MDNVSTVIVTLVTAASSAGAWQFWQSRLKVKQQADREEKAERTLFRDDLRERVAVLEDKLETAQREKEKQQAELAKVLAELREYKVRLELLEAENERLRKL